VTSKSGSLLSAAIVLGAVGSLNDDVLRNAINRSRKGRNRILLHQHNGGDPIRVRNTQGRNEKCACGSGKKFKSCCALRAPIKEIVDVTMAEKVESRLQGDV
jgi:hypothetical protein